MMNMCRFQLWPTSPIDQKGEEKIPGFFDSFWWKYIIWLVVSNIFYFHPYLGEMIQFDYIIFFKLVETTN